MLGLEPKSPQALDMFWYDGQLIEARQLHLDIADPGLCYGASCFTTMRVYDGCLNHPLTSWQSHCDRLHRTLTAFGWHHPDWQRLEQGARLMIDFPVLRMTVFSDGREWITGRSLPTDLKHRQTSGITAWLAREPLYRRSIPQHKTGNYLAAYLARNRASELEAGEAILLDSEGNWLETSTGNLWGWSKGCWYTPNLAAGILPGIARSRWLDFLARRQIKVRENIWTPEFCLTLEAIGYSNCVVDFIPIIAVLDRDQKTIYSLKQP